MDKEFDILNLLRLQITESIITSKVRELETLIKNEELIQIKKDYNDAKQELDRLEEDYRKLEANRKKIEDKVETNREKVKANQEKLFSGTIGSSKELLNYQEEIKSLENQNEKLEDDEIEIMMKIEQMDEGLSRARDQVNRLEKSLNKIKEDISKDAKEIETKLDAYKKKRKEVMSEIPDEYLEKYNKVKQRKGAISVTVIKNNFCSGCNMEIPTVEAEKIKDPNRIYNCPLCGRLSLIYNEEMDKIKKEVEDLDGVS